MPATKPPFRFWSFFFSLKGRVSRIGVWALALPARAAFIVAGVAVAIAVAAGDGDAFQMPDSPLLIVAMAIGTGNLLLLWPVFAVMFKRLQDIGATGLFALPVFWQIIVITMAIINLVTPDHDLQPYMSWLSLVSEGYLWLITLGLGFIPGTRGPNRYGPDPRGHETIQSVF